MHLQRVSRGASQTGGRLPSNEPKLHAHTLHSFRQAWQQSYPLSEKSDPRNTAEGKVAACPRRFGLCVGRQSCHTPCLHRSHIRPVGQGQLPPPAAIRTQAVNSTQASSPTKRKGSSLKSPNERASAVQPVSMLF